MGGAGQGGGMGRGMGKHEKEHCDWAEAPPKSMELGRSTVYRQWGISKVNTCFLSQGLTYLDQRAFGVDSLLHVLSIT